MQETRVQSLGQESPLEKGIATHSSILAWRIPWREEPGGLYSPWGCKESDKMLLQCFRIVMLRKTSDGPLDCKKINQSTLKKSTLNIPRKDRCWSSNTLATWPEEPTHWKRHLCWERLRAGREGGDRGWDSWMATLTQWTWVWAKSGRQWRTGKPGMLLSMRSQRGGHGSMTEQGLNIEKTSWTLKL